MLLLTLRPVPVLAQPVAVIVSHALPTPMRSAHLCTVHKLADRTGATTGPAFNRGINFNDPRFADVVDDALDFQDHRCGRPAAAGGVLPAPRPVTTKLLGYILSVVS